MLEKTNLYNLHANQAHKTFFPRKNNKLKIPNALNSPKKTIYSLTIKGFKTRGVRDVWWNEMCISKKFLNNKLALNRKYSLSVVYRYQQWLILAIKTFATTKEKKIIAITKRKSSKKTKKTKLVISKQQL